MTIPQPDGRAVRRIVEFGRVAWPVIGGIARRSAISAVQILLVLIGVLTALFFMMRLAGDPADVLAGPNPTPEQVQDIRELLGLDRPLYEQYAIFIGQTSQLDFGQSYHFSKPAMELVLARLPASLTLAVLAVALTIGVGVPIGINAAVHRGRLVDRGVMLLAAVGQAMPSFWLGIILILIFAVWLRVLPSFGSGDVQHLILPVITLAASFVARMARLSRSEMLEVLGQDYIRTAHAKGLMLRAVLWRHAMKNALIPVVTLAAIEFSVLFSGSVVVESVFGYSGMGLQMIEAIFNRDYPIVQATIFLVAVVVVLVNYGTDFVYRLADPRVRDAA